MLGADSLLHVNHRQNRQDQKNMANPTSIFSRKRDLAYLVFFLIHIPVLLCKKSPTCTSNPLNHLAINPLYM